MLNDIERFKNDLIPCKIKIIFFPLYFVFLLQESNDQEQGWQFASKVVAVCEGCCWQWRHSSEFVPRITPRQRFDPEAQTRPDQ